MPLNQNNLFNLPDLDTPIFRIFPIERFRQAMETRKLALVKPTAWEDRFENFLLQSAVRLNTGELASLAKLREKLYGQCWMLCPDSEAMWKLYSFPTQLPKGLIRRSVYQLNQWLNGQPRQQEGLKVRTTVKKLFSAFFQSNDPFCDLCYFMGRVQYMPQTELERLLADTESVTDMVFDSTGRGHARSLLLKRDSYSHEQEVRLIYAANSGAFDASQPLYLFDVDPNALIDEVILDPRLSHSKVNDRQRKVRSWGYQGPISQSPLNIPPSFVVDVDV